jgi:toxin FitB
VKASGGYLLDTNVISETRKKQAHPRVIAFLSSVPKDSLFLSVLTLGELRRGVAMRKVSDPAGAKILSAWVDGLEISFSDRILGVDAAAASRWGELSAQRSMPVIDTLLAATAIVHKLVLVTRNTSDVEDTGVATLNPWQN